MSSLSDNEKVNLASKLSELNFNDLLSVYNAVIEEAGEIKLDNENRKAACEELGVDMATAQGWQTVADITKHVDLSALCEKHPEAAKELLVSVLGIIGMFCPPVKLASAFTMNVPSETLSKVLGVALKASPDHLVHVLADYCANKKREALHEYELEESVVDGRLNLVVVCNDDLLFEQIKKLVETNDDTDDCVVGVRDGTVRIIRWDENKWEYRYTVNNISEKVLVIGGVKGVKNQIDVMNKKMDEFGVRYGWIGNIAYISANRFEIKNKKQLAEFFESLNTFDLPDEIKKDKSFKLNLVTGLKAAFFTPILIKDAYDDMSSVSRQQLFYGTCKFYFMHLQEFLANS